MRCVCDTAEKEDPDERYPQYCAEWKDRRKCEAAAGLGAPTGRCQWRQGLEKGAYPPHFLHKPSGHTFATTPCGTTLLTSYTALRAYIPHNPLRHHPGITVLRGVIAK